MEDEKMDNIEYKGYTINITQDENAESPREWDNLGKMLCFHKRYTLGDESLHENYSYDKDCKMENITDECSGWDEIEEVLKKEFQAVVVMPLWLYDHGGLSMKTCRHGYHGGWDCGQVGFVFATRKDILENYGCKKITKKIIERVENVLMAEVETYSQYLNGEVYGFNIEDKGGNFLDCCYGFYGWDFEENGLLSEARDAIDYDIKENLRKKQEKTKQYIKNNVALCYRT